MKPETSTDVVIYYAFRSLSSSKRHEVGIDLWRKAVRDDVIADETTPLLAEHGRIRKLPTTKGLLYGEMSDADRETIDCAARGELRCQVAKNVVSWGDFGTPDLGALGCVADNPVAAAGVEP